ncbi:MAG: molybdenum cofactor guanylyltransferase [Desulfovibrionaceae bacterium]
MLRGMVLAGGKSRRLGRDKAHIPLDGCSMLERMLGLVRSYCEEVYVSGRDALAEGIDAQWIPDDEPGLGPIGGILSGLQRLGGPLLVLACDLPLLTGETLEQLILARDARPHDAVMTTYLQVETGYIESLVAIYEAEAAPYLRRALENGEHKLTNAIPPELRHHIPYSHDEASVFFNLNYPADLALLKRFRATASHDNAHEDTRLEAAT